MTMNNCNTSSSPPRQKSQDNPLTVPTSLRQHNEIAVVVALHPLPPALSPVDEVVEQKLCSSSSMYPLGCNTK